MKTPSKNNVQLYSLINSNGKVRSNIVGQRNRRLAKRGAGRYFQKTNVKTMTKIIMRLMVMMVLFSFKSAMVCQQDNPIIGQWVWIESRHVDNKSYLTNPKQTGYSKKITFTSNGHVITYKNDLQIRISKYQLTRGVSILDKKVHDLITFEGLTYVVEELDDKNLTLASNTSDGFRSRFSK
ncbi:hypothetical protein [Flavobacterium sp. FlaQc-48]|uniref:hypothetical protein n=1 Tax=Flavobacterium sp. FlaQc-48 TaxID=3374181 RepID=UPI003756AB15